MKNSEVGVHLKDNPVKVCVWVQVLHPLSGEEQDSTEADQTRCLKIQ